MSAENHQFDDEQPDLPANRQTADHRPAEHEPADHEHGDRQGLPGPTQAQQNRTVPTRRRFIATTTAALPVVMTLASKPAQAYECSHSALSSGRGSGRHSHRRNPRACYNDEKSNIEFHYDRQISYWKQEYDRAMAKEDQSRADHCQKQMSNLNGKKFADLKHLHNRYNKYPGF